MKQKRIVIAAPKSGSGKTVLTCGLLAVLAEAGRDVMAFKCGPDYIDPMFHRTVLGIPGGNLDTFFSDGETIRRQVAGSGHETVVIEGAMGIYDGIAGAEGTGSCYDVARVTGTPILLTVDAKGMGPTLISLIGGILRDDTGCLIRGILLNRISANYYQELAPLLQKRLDAVSAERGVPVKLLGGIPVSPDVSLESRHLGLCRPEEIADLKDKVRAAAALLRDSADLEELWHIMDDAGELPKPVRADETEGSGVTLAVARDEAFCFYYEENLRTLRDAGIRIVEFSPLHDRKLPAEADGILLGGGYPELHAEALSQNRTMLRSIRDAVRSGMPGLAECGGFMILFDEMTGEDGVTHPMTGLIPGTVRKAGRSARFGYITVQGQKPDTLISGLSIRGHEFHYYETTDNGTDALAVKPGSGRSWPCMHAGPSHAWGFPHLYYPSCPEFVIRFRDEMIRYGKNRSKQDGKLI